MRLMAQNNSVFVFVRKTSNNNWGRPNVRTDMNQVTNLKSLGLTWKNPANLQGVSISFWSPYFCNCLLCGRQCCKTNISISWCREADNSPAPTWWSSLLSSPLPPPLVFGNSFSNFCYGCLSSFISSFAILAKSINDFWGVLVIFGSIYKRDALATGCHYCFNKLNAFQVCVACLLSIS